MPAPTPYQLTSEDTIDLEEAQIRQLVLDRIEAQNRHNVRAFTLVYADDAELTPVIGTTYEAARPSTTTAQRSSKRSSKRAGSHRAKSKYVS
jgi:hypothetical protein